MSELHDESNNLQVSDLLFHNIKYFTTGNVDQNVLDVLKNGGAERMNYFSDYVTHLICGEDPEDTDISDAIEIYEIPAVMPKWFLLCASLKRLISFKPYLYNNKKLFCGLTFCFSQITTDRDTLWSIITYNGGIVQLNLDSNCTHLVTINTTSSKYNKALSLGPSIIEIVTPDWVLESVHNHSLVNAEIFHPKLIIIPKIIKHESTSAITGFESELSEEEQQVTEDSTQALLEKLKQRMPWNQPPVTTTAVTTKDVVPPNVVAPSYTSRLPITPTVQQNLLQAQQERALAQAQQLMQSQQISEPQAQSPQHASQHIQQNQQLLQSPVQGQQMLQSPVQRQQLLQSQIQNQQIVQQAQVQGQHLLQTQSLLQTQMQRQLSQSSLQTQMLESPIQEQHRHPPHHNTRKK